MGTREQGRDPTGAGPAGLGPEPSASHPVLALYSPRENAPAAVPAETRQPVQARGHSGNPKDCIQAWAPNPKTISWKLQNKQTNKTAKVKSHVCSVSL